MKKTAFTVAALFLSTTAQAAFVSDFKAKADLYFADAVTQSITATANGEGVVIFKANVDYFGSGDKINKVMAVESARLFREVPSLNRLKLTIPNEGRTYSLNITRSQIEAHYGLKFAGMGLEMWRERFTTKFDTKPSRAAFAKKFVAVK
jgi:hypothetical protein